MYVNTFRKLDVVELMASVVNAAQYPYKSEGGGAVSYVHVKLLWRFGNFICSHNASVHISWLWLMVVHDVPVVEVNMALHVAGVFS